MKKTLVALASIGLLTAPAAVVADELDTSSEIALEQVQALLNDRTAREQAVQKSADAKAADDAAKQLMGSEANTAELYALSAEIFESLTRASGGDAGKMSTLLKEASQNPSAFADRLSPELKAKLRALSEKVSTRKAQ